MPSICRRARWKLLNSEADVSLQCLPRNATQKYVHSSSILNLVQRHGRDIFSCVCEDCTRHGKAVGIPLERRIYYYEEAELTTTYLRIFGLLIYIQCPGLILAFQRNRIYLDDRNLDEASLLNFLRRLADLDNEEVSAICKLIIEHQWRFLVERLDTRKSGTVLDSRRVLPFQDEKLIGKGAYAVVYRYRVRAEDRGEGLQACESEFVRKVFHQDKGPAALNMEWENGPKVRGIEHPHVMPYLCAFQHGNVEESPVYFIVMEYAQATLEDFFNSSSFSIFGSSQELWKQIEGTTEGLKELHQKRLFHMDLKPQNILILNGVMKIADFGISRYIEENAKSSDAPELTTPNDSRQGVYAPPESIIASEQFDVYSLAGIMSEAACRDIGGKKKLKRYRDLRTKEKRGCIGRPTFHLNGEMKKAVTNQHDILLSFVRKGQTGTRVRSIDLWQQEFFGDGKIFSLIQEMLTPYRDKAPSLDLVIKELQGRLVQTGISPADN